MLVYMTIKIYTQEERENNTLAVARHYEKNKYEVQRKRKLRDIELGMKVRPATIIKYGLQAEAKNHGLEVKETTQSNPVRLLSTGSKEAKDMQKKIEDKLNEYDVEISKMVQAKVDIARKVSKGEPRIEPSKKITWSDLNTFIDQVAAFTHTTKKGYRGTLNTFVKKIFECDPEKDIANCFNNHEETIKNIKTAKSDRTNELYVSLGRFYSLPISLAKYIPEFEERFTRAAHKAYKKELDLFIERTDVKQIEKHDDFIIDWKEVLRSREWWREEAEETGSISSLRGYTIMSLYTYTPPLRNDYGCVMLISKEPTDKKRNYYWAEKGAFYLNHFKTMKKYPDEPPIMFSPTLKKIVNNWIKKSGAKVWLFSKNTSDPYAGCIGHNNAGSFASIVKKVASRYVQQQGQPPVSINVLRKSKVTSLKGKTEEHRQKVARLMRHSLKTATFAYMRTAFSSDSQQSAVESEGDYFQDDFYD